MNKKELAKIFIVPESTIAEWEAAGMPRNEIDAGGEAEYDLHKVFAWKKRYIAVDENLERELKEEWNVKAETFNKHIRDLNALSRPKGW